MGFYSIRYELSISKNAGEIEIYVFDLGRVFQGNCPSVYPCRVIQRSTPPST